MKEKLLALLINGFAGVRKDGLAHLAGALALNVTTEEEAQALVGKLTKDQVDTFIKDFRAGVDKEVTESNSTFKANLEKKYDFVEKGNPDPNKKTDPANPEDIDAKLEAMLEAKLAPVQKELEGYRSGRVAETRLQRLTDKLSTCKNEAFKTKALKDFSYMRFESDEHFDEYLSETESNVTSFNQSITDADLSKQGYPFMGNKDVSGEDAFINSMKEINKTEN